MIHLLPAHPEKKKIWFVQALGSLNKSSQSRVLVQAKQASEALAKRERDRHEAELLGERERHAQVLAAAQEAARQLQEQSARDLQDAVRQCQQDMEIRLEALSRAHDFVVQKLHAALNEQQTMHDEQVSNYHLALRLCKHGLLLHPQEQALH